MQALVLHLAQDGVVLEQMVRAVAAAARRRFLVLLR